MKKRSEAEWQELATNYEASGKRQTEWCKLNGINVYTFRDRLSRLRKSQGKPRVKELLSVTPGVKEVQPTKWVNVTPNPDRSEIKSEIKIIISGHEVMVANDFDELTLIAVCRALTKI